MYPLQHVFLPLTIWRVNVQPRTRRTIGVRTVVFLLSHLYVHNTEVGY